jgi:hypothetical protein
MVIFPRIVSAGIALPFDEILESLRFPMKAVSGDGLDLEFFFSINDLWKRARIVIPILLSLLIWGQESGVEDVMDGPGGRQCELIRHWGYHFDDFEWSMTFGREFQ